MTRMRRGDWLIVKDKKEEINRRDGNIRKEMVKEGIEKVMANPYLLRTFEDMDRDHKSMVKESIAKNKNK